MFSINSRMPFNKQQSVCAFDPAESTNTGFDRIIYLFTGWFLCQWIKLYDIKCATQSLICINWTYFASI